MAYQCRMLSQVDQDQDFEVVDGAGIPPSTSCCYSTNPLSSSTSSRARLPPRASSSSTQAARPPNGDPSRERVSYMSSLRSAFSRGASGNETQKKKKGDQGYPGKQGTSTPPPPPPPPPSSRRSSYSSDSSPEEDKEVKFNLDSIAGVFSAALSFGETCDRRARAARTVTDLPLAAAYDLKATWGGW